MDNKQVKGIIDYIRLGKNREVILPITHVAAVRNDNGDTISIIIDDEVTEQLSELGLTPHQVEQIREDILSNTQSIINNKNAADKSFKDLNEQTAVIRGRLDGHDEDVKLINQTIKDNLAYLVATYYTKDEIDTKVKDLDDTKLNITKYDDDQAIVNKTLKDLAQDISDNLSELRNADSTITHNMETITNQIIADFNQADYDIKQIIATNKIDIESKLIEANTALEKSLKKIIDDNKTESDAQDKVLQDNIDTLTESTQAKVDKLYDDIAETFELYKVWTETKQYIDTKIDDLIGGDLEESLNSLKEIVDALKDDSGALESLSEVVAKKLNISDFNIFKTQNTSILNTKVDKVDGKSLIADTEIKRLLTMETNANYITKISQLINDEEYSKLNEVVQLIGNQSINGIKTFNDSPNVPTPTLDTNATNKQYVDTNLNTKADKNNPTLVYTLLDDTTITITNDSTGITFTHYDGTVYTELVKVYNDRVVINNAHDSNGNQYAIANDVVNAIKRIDTLESDVQSLKDTKADKTTVYTKTQIDDTVNDINQRIDDTNSTVNNNKTEADTKINDIHDKFNEYATNVYVDGLLEDTLTYEPVAPEPDMVSDEHIITSVYLEGVLEDYANRDEVIQLIINKAIQDIELLPFLKKYEYTTKTDVNTILEAYYDSNEMDTIVETINTTLGTKFDKSEIVNYYTKTQVDAKIAEKLLAYDTIDEAKKKLDLKANVGDSYLKGETYNVTEVNDEINAALIPYATNVSVNDKLSTKADSDDVYTKSEVYTKTQTDTKISTAVSDGMNEVLEVVDVDTIVRDEDIETHVTFKTEDGITTLYDIHDNPIAPMVNLDKVNAAISDLNDDLSDVKDNVIPNLENSINTEIEEIKRHHSSLAASVENNTTNISNVANNVNNVQNDLKTNYLTSIQTNEAISEAISHAVPSLEGYATEEFVTGKVNEILDGAPEALDTLKELADALTESGNELETLITTVGTKADKDSVYTKEEVTGLIESATPKDIYTKGEVNDIIDGVNDVVDTKADKEYVDTELTSKANKEDVYTKTASDLKYATIVNVDESISNVNTSIENINTTKADKDTVYTKSEVDSKVEVLNDAISGVSTVVDGKADKTTVNELETLVGTKASIDALNDIEAKVDTNAANITTNKNKITTNTNDIETINETLPTKADKSTVTSLSGVVDGKADKIVVNDLSSTVETLSVETLYYDEVETELPMKQYNKFVTVGQMNDAINDKINEAIGDVIAAMLGEGY